LAKFIEDSRSVSADPIIQKRALEHIYSYLPKGSNALTYIQDYFNNHNPFKINETHTAEISISSTMPLSERSWQVEWLETCRDLSGNVSSNTKWKSILSLEFNPPTTEKAILANPLGIFVTQFSWVQQL
jgi:type IV secretion system protein VirB5